MSKNKKDRIWVRASHSYPVLGLLNIITLVTIN
nr:MAG TPA: hypothetical protein [Caudoviricetes sp.]